VTRALSARLFFGAVLVGWLPAATAEESPAPIKVQVRADRRQATIGDPIVLKVIVTHPPDVALNPPSPLVGEGTSTTLEALGPIAPPGGNAARGKAEAEEVFLFRAQAFETGKISLPAFRVDWRRTGGASGSVTTDPTQVEIGSVLKAAHEKPSDLKPPAELPPPPFPWRTAVGIALLTLIAALAAAAWHRRKRSGEGAAASRPESGPPPHEQAYRDLERLLASGLLDGGRVKEFHVELAEIAKRYLAGRFEIETLERTTEEVLDDLKKVRVGVAPLGTARELLSETDIVKFAKYLPSAEEIRRNVERVYRLVDLTKPIPPSRVPAAGQVPPGLSTERAG